MPYIELESLDDARLDVFARLTEAQLRNKLEPEKGIFIVESEKVIDRALLGGVQPLSMLMTPEWVDRTREIVSRAEAACEEPGGMPVFVVPAKEAERLTGFAVTRGILLACRRPQLPSVEDLLARVDAEKVARAAAVVAGELDPGEVGNMHDASRRAYRSARRHRRPYERRCHFSLGGGHGNRCSARNAYVLRSFV